MHLPAENFCSGRKIIRGLALRLVFGTITQQVHARQTPGQTAPGEMDDLEFQPAMPVFAALLPLPEGRAVAGPLYNCGLAAIPVLLSACMSTNSMERINGSAVLQSFKDQRLVEPLLALLRDPV